MTLIFDPTVPAHVYLIEQDGEYKIGCSGNPGLRLTQVADPARARIVHLIPSAAPFAIEAALHRRFAGHRINGEWFALTPDDVASICSAGRADAIEDLPTDLQQDRRVRKELRTIQVRVSPDLYAALMEHIANTRRSKGVELTLALESHIQAAGKSPRP